MERSDREKSPRQPVDLTEQNATLQAAASQPVTVFRTERTINSNSSDVGSNFHLSKSKSRPRRYQLHLWINEREYTLLKSLAESEDEPMSRIVRRLFGHLKHLLEREAS